MATPTVQSLSAFEDRFQSRYFMVKGRLRCGKARLIWTFLSSRLTGGPEGRLSLSQGEIAGGKELLKELLKELPENLENWMFFQSATLNLDGLTAYTSPLMTPPAQLCDGPF